MRARRMGMMLALVAGLAMAAGPAPAAEGKVTGKFVGNGKDVKLSYAVAVPEDEKWENEDAWSVVLAEKAPGPDMKPAWDASFGKMGSAVIVKINRKGELYSTQLYHAALEQKPFATSGTVHLDQFKIENGVLSGHLATSGPETFFDDKWELDLTFTAPISK